MKLRARLAAALLLALTLAPLGCDEEEAVDEWAEPALEPISDALRTQALEAARAAETAGRPAQQAWDRAVRSLGPDVPTACPAEALAAPRRETLVMTRAPRFSTDLQADVLSIIEGRYGHTMPALGIAERIRFQLDRGDGALLREALASEVPEPPRQAIVVLRVEALRVPVETGADTFRAGELVGTAYLLDADLQPVCALAVDSTNSSFITSDVIGGMDMFDARALLELFEHAQAYIDRTWDPNQQPTADDP
jgi:hypothetical protein